MPSRSGDEEGAAYRNWLYDPSDYIDEEMRSEMWFESPTELVAAEEYLHDRVRGEYVNGWLNRGPDMATVEWAMFYADQLVNAPSVQAYGGSFDASTARETTATHGGSVDDAESLGSVNGYELVAYDEDRYGLYKDGEAVNVGFASEDVVRDLVAERAESPLDRAEGVEQLIDCIGFGTTASLNVQTGDDLEFTGSGVGYTVDGETTAVRFAHLNGEMSLDQLRELGDDSDALSSVTVDEDGPVRWLEGTVDTDRTALDGTMFHVGEAPFE
ncbi:hypothetical protein B2G88_10580 [Natronolimnobius baerhuensis]|uniref:Uncharacterized protein n=2 Tax=Natronolimnobius baerhuensis TaxID=253108 RepID=A0A202E970_9EURY|nr:hypothetical protein B2G88_10580 [Natronolimnobius baerhuensis]